MDDVNEDLRRVVAGLRTHLGLRGRSGLLGVPRRPTRRHAPKPESELAIAPGAPAGAPAGSTAGSTFEPDESASDIEGAAPPEGVSLRPVGARGLLTVRDDLGDCQRCKLSKGRKNLVYGVGNPDAHLVFVGEGPGADEDEQGEPFVGKAGQLLNKMIEAMGYRREDVYICNVVKCRPPGNRNPEPDEIAACEPFLKQQLEAIRPRVIVTLGKFAAQCLLRDDTPISRLRGSFRSYQGIQLMPTFHPAYLLRDPSKKKEAWDDLKTVMSALRALGFEPPR
jgi:DNA polymerase